jgi:hypothetical protein
MGSPILLYFPGGGFPTTIPGAPPTFPGAGGGDITQLVNGQSYIQIIFDVAQSNSDWEFTDLQVVNTTDLSPLNIWPGILTAKSTTGFTLQFNGFPDSSNYFLHWSFTGTGGGSAVTPSTGYTLVGPSSGYISVASTNFTVALPVGGTLASPVTVTPSDGGGGTFTPTSVVLTTAAPSATFTYTPASYGAKTISVTNSGGLTDPASLSYTSVASTYTLTGPSSGAVSVPSTNFTVALPGGGVLLSAVTVTPNDAAAGGTFTPMTVALTTAAPSATFTYTPASTGAKTISTTNNGALTNPSSLTYTATAAALHDGDPVSTWVDSSLNGHDATMTGSNRPIFKTSILGGKPVVRFTTSGASKLNLASAISATSPWTIFAVMKANSGSVAQYSLNTTAAVNWPSGPLEGADGNFYFADKTTYGSIIGGGYYTAFHVFTVNRGVGSQAYVDGTNVATGGGAVSTTGDFDTLGYNGFGTPTYSDGDLAEVIIYSGQVAIRAKLLLVLTALITTGQIPSPAEADALLASGDLVALEAYLILHGVPVEQARDTLEPMTVGDRANIEKYLGTKYGITVAGGTAADPSTVTGLLGWWKADSLG